LLRFARNDGSLVLPLTLAPLDLSRTWGELVLTIGFRASSCELGHGEA
jgi:hypothetical protein